ncbi:hypothetical protein CGK19_24870, partial [Vibrio parahaemolyticus]
YFSQKKTAQSIKEIKKDYVIVKLSDPMKCSESITKEFNKGNNKVWVVGNCVIYPSLNIQDTAGSITPRSLVV